MSAADPSHIRSDSSAPPAGRGRSLEPVPYNFRRPDKFSKDHIRSVQSIHDAFGRSAGHFLASKVRSAVHVDLASVEQTTLAEYLDGLPFPAVLFLSALEPLVGRAIVQVDMELAFLVVDRMLGGTGTLSTYERTSATVSEVEILLLEDLGNGLFSELCSAWEQVARLRSPGSEVALSATQVQGLLPSEVALVIRHEIRMLNVTGQLSVCLPASMLEPLTPRLNARLLFANPRADAGNQAARDLAARLENVALTIRAELGRVSIRVAELLSLEVGDVIRLDTPADSALPVLIEDRPRFLGYPGQRSGQAAIRIAERLDEESLPAEPSDEEHDA